jgi:hypothetical protein
MDKSRLNYLIDLGMAITFILAFFTGVIKMPEIFRLIAGSGVRLPMAQISFVHDWSGIAMGILVFAHIVLHWNWMICMTKRLFGQEKEGE